LFFFGNSFCYSQNLFENPEDKTSESHIEFNGYIKGAYFIGESLTNKDKTETQSAYGESSFKIKFEKNNSFTTFTEIRLKSGYEYEKNEKIFNIREAYLKFKLKNHRILVGKKILVWGRADGFNPTNVLTPQNRLARSSNIDDKRLSNWIFKSDYDIGLFNLEFVWIPMYESSIIPFDIIAKKRSINFLNFEKPEFELRNSSVAIKLNLLASKIDGSISYFSGYNINPSLDGNIIKNKPYFQPNIYTIKMIGSDFQTTLGGNGLRGEFAYTVSEKNKNLKFTPNSEIQSIIGLDRTLGSFTLNFQYLTKFVIDFKRLVPPNDLKKTFYYQLQKQNRIFSGQQNSFNQTFIFRLSNKFFHETLNINILSSLNLTTNEKSLNFIMDYSFSDSITLSLGLDQFSGPDETLYGQIGEIVNAGFLEIKMSF
jgi:hypothetical protein